MLLDQPVLCQRCSGLARMRWHLTRIACLSSAHLLACNACLFANTLAPVLCAVQQATARGGRRQTTRQAAAHLVQPDDGEEVMQPAPSPEAQQAAPAAAAEEEAEEEAAAVAEAAGAAAALEEEVPLGEALQELLQPQVRRAGRWLLGAVGAAGYGRWQLGAGLC